MPQETTESVAVENLQRYLRQLSYHEPSITPPPIDGIFASDTQRALREFQAWQQLPVTGTADHETWEKLYDAYRASLTKHTPPRTVAVFPFLPIRAELSAGKEGFAVTVLQHMLQELSASYSALEHVAITGIYDEATTQAIQSFQACNRLPINGKTDVPTWNAVTDQYNTLFALEPFL